MLLVCCAAKSTGGRSVGVGALGDLGAELLEPAEGLLGAGLGVDDLVGQAEGGDAAALLLLQAVHVAPDVAERRRHVVVCEGDQGAIMVWTG